MRRALAAGGLLTYLLAATPTPPRNETRTGEPQLWLKPSVFRLLAGARVCAFPDALRPVVL